VISADQLSVTGVMRTQRARLKAVLAASLVAAVGAGVAAGALTVSNHSAVVAIFAGALLPILFWRALNTAVPLLVFFGAAFARYGDQYSSLDILAKVPIWRSLNDGFHLAGLYVLPVELVLALALLIWIAREGAARRLRVPKTDLSVSLAILVGAALLAEVHGLAAHGDFKISLYELRPFLYLAGCYLLAAQALRSRGAFQAVLWALVLGAAYRGLIGTDAARHVANVYPRPNELLEHDESFFFGTFLVLTIALWVFGIKGWLRRVATALAPFVLYANLANNRRAAWIILPAGLVILALVAWVRNPDRRKTMAWIYAVLLLLGTGYVVAFRHSESTFAFPAHAIWSNFQPDVRDASSNLYRDLENAALAQDIRQSVVVGTGFGLPFGHGSLGVDVSSFDPLVFYIPHNSVLWVWVKAGVLGMFAFWWMAAVALVTAARVARRGDRYTALVATMGMVAVAGYFFLGWVDVGLSAVRVAVTVGCLLGAVEAAAAAAGLSRSMILDQRGGTVVIRPSAVSAAPRSGVAASWGRGTGSR
jgi:hypothetical protein